MPKLTRNEKTLINLHVTQETWRCLSILREYEAYRGEKNSNQIFKQCIKKMISGNPYFEHNPDLQKELKGVK